MTHKFRYTFSYITFFFVVVGRGTVIVPHAHWEAYGRGSLPLHYLVSDSATPHCVSDPLPQPLWDHRSTGQL